MKVSLLSVCLINLHQVSFAQSFPSNFKGFTRPTSQSPSFEGLASPIQYGLVQRYSSFHLPPPRLIHESRIFNHDSSLMQQQQQLQNPQTMPPLSSSMGDSYGREDDEDHSKQHSCHHPKIILIHKIEKIHVPYVVEKKYPVYKQIKIPVKVPVYVPLKVKDLYYHLDDDQPSSTGSSENNLQEDFQEQFPVFQQQQQAYPKTDSIDSQQNPQNNDQATPSGDGMGNYLNKKLPRKMLSLPAKQQNGNGNSRNFFVNSDGFTEK